MCSECFLLFFCCFVVLLFCCSVVLLFCSSVLLFFRSRHRFKKRTPSFLPQTTTTVLFVVLCCHRHRCNVDMHRDVECNASHTGEQMQLQIQWHHPSQQWQVQQQQQQQHQYEFRKSNSSYQPQRQRWWQRWCAPFPVSASLEVHCVQQDSLQCKQWPASPQQWPTTIVASTRRRTTLHVPPTPTLHH